MIDARFHSPFMNIQHEAKLKIIYIGMHLLKICNYIDQRRRKIQKNLRALSVKLPLQ